MADHARQPQPRLTEDVPAAGAEGMDFFELLRRLERGGRRFGHGSRPDREPARLGQHLRLGFAVRDVAALTPAAERTPARVSVALFGLLGPEGPLPLHLTRRALDRLAQRWFVAGVEGATSDTTFLDFANVLQHRMIALFYRAWADQTPAVQEERASGGRMRTILGALAGADGAALRSEKLAQAASLGHQVLGPERLAGLSDRCARCPRGDRGVRRRLVGDSAPPADAAGRRPRRARPRRGDRPADFLPAEPHRDPHRPAGPCRLRGLPAGRRPARDPAPCAPARHRRDARRRFPPGAARAPTFPPPASAPRGSAGPPGWRPRGRRTQRDFRLRAVVGLGDRRREGRGMSLLMTLIKAPRPQPVRQMRLEEGELVIGRSAEADWRIDDPDQYVSRAHCTVSARDGVFSVTDTSSGGLFVDGSHKPLGAGRSVPLSDGMRLRLGDYVVQIDLASSAASAPPAARSAGKRRPTSTPTPSSPTPVAPPPRPERPPDLPDPFERTGGRRRRRRRPGASRPARLRRSVHARPPVPDRSRERPVPPGFDWDMPASAAPAATSPPPPDPFGWEPSSADGRTPGDPGAAAGRRRPSQARGSASGRGGGCGGAGGLPSRPWPRPGGPAPGRPAGAHGGLRPGVPDDGGGADAAPPDARRGKGQRAHRPDRRQRLAGQSVQVHADRRRCPGGADRAAERRLLRCGNRDLRRGARPRRRTRSGPGAAPRRPCAG